MTSTSRQLAALLWRAQRRLFERTLRVEGGQVASPTPIAVELLGGG